jgi:type I site-specific restriction endonuclease
MNKKELSERNICTKFITTALRQAGWDELSQLRDEVSFRPQSRTSRLSSVEPAHQSI